jgi:hypothetical protein
MKRLLALFGGVLLAATSAAHEGEAHHDEAPPPSAAALAARPHRLEDGSLFLPKAAQHLLGIRTRSVSGATGAVTLTLLAEVQAQPAAAVTVTAPEPGLLQAERAWPLPGQPVRAGAVLAWLRPQLSQREGARRRALLADLDQKLVIARLNVERLGLQGAVNPDNQAASGNIYYEQAAAERDALERERALVADSLRDRVPLRAQVSGRVLAVPARAGEVASAGQVLFQLADPARPRLAALSYDPDLGRRLRAAQAGGVALAYRGQESLADAPGWRLLFDPVAGQEAPDWSPGQPLQLEAQVRDEAIDADACVRAGAGGVQLWLHAAPERFVALRRASCGEAVAALAPGDRLVTQGAAVLAQYR